MPRFGVSWQLDIISSLRMTPEHFAQAVNASEARAPSAARLAAEAFFAPPSSSVSAATSPDVTVVRHKQTSAEPGSDSMPATEAPSHEGSRAPRVFRLEAGTAAALVSPDLSESKTQDEVAKDHLSPDAIEQAEAPQSALRRLPRKKAVRRHGEVTIIRPAAKIQDVAEVAQNEVVPTEPVASDQMQELDADWPRYPALLKQLRLLQAQAEAVKRSEVKEVLRWIQAAIRDHAITAQELGLR